MAQRKRNPTNMSSHRAATSLVAAGSSLALHSVDTPPDTGSIWGRRRVLLLNSTYEPLTALPMRRAIIMLLSSKTSQELATAEGKAKLRNQIRKIINETIGASPDRPLVVGVVFTSFIVQQ